jgi:tRNA(His) 5'-end guanylyltransferase
MATAKFMHMMPAEYQARLPHFDARVWQVPSREEAANVILWRAQDAKRNAVSSTCRSLYSAKQMQNKDQAAMLEMITEKGVDFVAHIPKDYREGVYFRREQYYIQVEGAGDALRSRIARVEMPYFGDVINRTAVVFDGARPLSKPDWRYSEWHQLTQQCSSAMI